MNAKFRTIIVFLFTILGVLTNNYTQAQDVNELALQGDAEAQLKVGYKYFQGDSVDKNYEEAAKWFRKAAEQGNAEAQYILGVMYRIGEGVNQNNKEALNWYKKAAEQGIAEAQNNMGLMYNNGYGVDQNYEEAVRWYHMAADQGLATAQFNLGIMYEIGHGVPQNYKEAAKWYRKAAEQGDAGAQNNLGVLYKKGVGVSRDYLEAAKWYRKAAEQGDAEAQNNLGVLYEYGEGVNRDFNEAQKWYIKAAQQGHKVAQYKLDLLDKYGDRVNHKYEVSNYDLLRFYVLDNNSYKISDYAKKIYEQHKDSYSFEEYFSIGLGAMYYKNDNEKVAQKMGEFALKGLEKELLVDISIIMDSVVDQKKDCIKHFLEFYEGIVSIYASFPNNDLKLNVSSLILFFHNFIYNQRNDFFKNDYDAYYLLTIISAENLYLLITNDNKTLFTQLIPDFISISDTLSSDFNVISYSRFKLFEKSVLVNSLNYGYVWHIKQCQENGSISVDDLMYHDGYVCDRANYFLKLKEFEINSISYCYDSVNYTFYHNDNNKFRRNNDWKQIQSQLRVDEAALLLFNNPILQKATNSPFYNGYYITQNCREPFEVVGQYLDTIITNLFNNDLGITVGDSFKNSYEYLKMKLFMGKEENNIFNDNLKPKKLYICACDDIENMDVAYCDNRIVMKYDLFDINKSNDLQNYNNDFLTYYGDIDYGKSSCAGGIDRLNKDKETLSCIRSVFKNKVNVLTGDKVKKNDFYIIPQNTEIFHISTHGESIDNDVIPRNRGDVGNLFVDISGDYVLALSNYNEDNLKNSISANEIKKIDMTNIDLVFLDACNTGYSHNILIHGNSSMSKAFYISGVSNIISNQNIIDENIAFDFTSTFYLELVKDKEKNYHDVFYRVKRQIIEKYKNVLVKDQMGRPDLGIVLWE